MWLPQSLMRHFIRNETAILEAGEEDAGGG